MGENASFQFLNISDVLPNRFQPRIKFDDESLDELAESISRFGVIEPIVVRPIGKKYEIIAGERRYKASKLASKTTIPSIVINLSDKDSEELALLENVQRQSLNPIEEAVSYKRILDMGYISREELSKKIGKPQSVILNKTRLLNLADEVQNYLLNDKISERHARALLSISNLDDQVKMLHRIVDERLTVKKTNREIRKYMESNKDDIEMLFNDERGNDKMDIDKIMREAQDINAEPNVTGSMPDLMANPASSVQEGNSQIFDGAPVNSEVVSQETNKFVNVQQPIEGQEVINQAQSNINQVPSDINNNVNFDSMFNGSMNADSAINMNNINNNPNVNSVSVSVPSQAEVIPTQNNVINEPNNNLVSGVDNQMSSEISGIVSDALKNQSVVSPSTENSEISSPTIDNIPDFNINTSVNNEPIPTPVVNNETDMINQNTNVIPQNDQVGSPVSDVSVPIINDQFNNGATDSLVNGVASPTPQINIPETPQVNIPEAPQVNVPEAPQVNVVSNVPDFGRIVQRLRECADEIEKSGHFVNLEEIDLGNQYKVIFTFDK